MTVLSAPMSRLGFGVSGPHASLAVPRHHTIKLIREAIDLGINTFDTAPQYGKGEAEIRLGQAIVDRDRSKLVLISKAGIPERGMRDFSPDGIERSLEASLARLKTDYLDVLLLQGVNSDEMTDELIARLRQFFKDGRCGEIGISGRGDEVQAAIEQELLAVILTPIYAGMPDDRIAFLADQVKAGRHIIGIEALSAAHRPSRVPLSAADLWYWARQTFRRPEASQGMLPPAEALKWSLDLGVPQCTLFLTTKSEHLRANAALMQAH